MVKIPNWCENNLEIKTYKLRGKRKELVLKEFIMFAASNDNVFDFNDFIPYPQEFKEKDEANKKDGSIQDGYNDGGYEWCIKKWGTKWSAISATINTQNLSTGKLRYYFDTAWSPSTLVTRKASELFPELIFKHKFKEEGMDFKGKEVFQAGKLVSLWEK